MKHIWYLNKDVDDDGFLPTYCGYRAEAGEVVMTDYRDLRAKQGALDLIECDACILAYFADMCESEESQ